QGASAAQSPSASWPHAPAPHSPAPADPVISTWGPPQTASWARGDQAPATAVAGQRTGRIGDALETQGLEGEQLRLQLLEVQDPADYLFGAAGYRLDEGERAIVVHTEITNIGQLPFASLPDNYLELLTDDDPPVTKAAISLTSRPPHRIGVQPGETLGGHTVYVLPETTTVHAVRWSPRPEPDERTLTWSLAE
ncbi:MAG: AsnC family protein, partial [Actinophytocola sp.]|nr:AsnC family protein [Actinophytocola sp.]